jgi:hypothetical protein
VPSTHDRLPKIFDFSNKLRNLKDLGFILR